MLRLVPVLLAAAAFAAGCAALPDRADVAGVRSFYLQEVGDPECAVATECEIAGDPHRIFRIASLGKLYVHLALRRMERDGRLDLDMSVQSALRTVLPPEYGSVLLRDLLMGRSGLPRDFLNPWNPCAWHKAFMSGLFGYHIYSDFDTREDFEEWLSCWRTLSHVRSREPQYSNVGFALLVMCVESATGKSIDRILRDELVVPLGLEDTSFCPVGEATDRLSPACAGKLPWLFRRGAHVPENRLGPALRGMGSVFSSVSDCVKVFREYWQVIDEELVLRPIDADRDGWSCGLLNVKTLHGGRRILYRFGMIYGGSSFVAFEPSSRRILVILRNVTSWPASEDFELSARHFDDSSR